MKRSVAHDQRVTQGDGEDQEPEGDQVPQGDPGQRDHLENMGLWDLKDQWAQRGILECRVILVPWDLEARRV